MRRRHHPQRRRHGAGPRGTDRPIEERAAAGLSQSAPALAARAGAAGGSDGGGARDPQPAPREPESNGSRSPEPLGPWAPSRGAAAAGPPEMLLSLALLASRASDTAQITGFGRALSPDPWPERDNKTK